MAIVFLNGEFMPPDEAMVGALDAGLQHGVGLFETMLASGDGRKPRIARLEDHIERLCESAKSLGLSTDLRAPALADAVVETARRSGLLGDGARVRIRLTVTGGAANFLQRASPDPAAPTPPVHEPTVLIHAQRATDYPRPMFERGVGVVIADLRVNPLDPTAGHKSLNYWARLRELQSAAARRAAEALVFQVTNHLAGGCVSNTILVKDDRLVTPIARGEEAEVTRSPGAALPSPVLPGVTRAWAIEHARANGRSVERRMVSIDDVLDADEVLLTNSSWGVLPVVKVEREAIGDGVVGPVGADLCGAWAEEIG